MKKRFCVLLLTLAALLFSGCSSASRAEWKASVEQRVEERLPTEDTAALVAQFNLSYDEEKLVEGERAFYIPNSFSEGSNLEDFTLLDLLSDGTAVYAFISDSYIGGGYTLNTELPYETGSRSDLAGARVLVLMACNPFDKVYAVYHLERVSDTTSFTAQKRVSGGRTIYVLSYDAKVATYPVKKADPLPQMEMDRRFGVDFSELATLTDAEIFEPESTQLQINGTYCVNTSDLYVEFYADIAETENPYGLRGETDRIATDERLRDETGLHTDEDLRKWAEESQETYVPDSIAKLDEDLEKEDDVLEEDIPDTFLLHYMSALLSYDYPDNCGWEYSDGALFTQLENVTMELPSGRRVSADEFFSRPMPSDNSVEQFVVRATVDGLTMEGFFTVTDWEEREFRWGPLMSGEKVRLKVPVISPVGVAYTVSPAEDGKRYVALSDSYLSGYLLDDEKCSFYRNLASDKVTLKISDSKIFATRDLQFGSTTGVAFISDDSLYVCPTPLKKNPPCYSLSSDGSILTLSPILYSDSSFCPIGTDALLLASFDDGVVRCDFTSGQRHCLLDWPCYAITRAKSGNYWAIGYQTTDRTFVDFDNFPDARIYEVTLDENKSAVLTLQKKLREDPTLWSKLLSDAGKQELWRNYCSGGSDYAFVRDELQETVSAYQDFISARIELCGYMDALRLLSEAELITLDKALFACENWGALDDLLETTYKRGKLTNPDDTYDKLVEQLDAVESTETPDADEKKFWSPELNRGYYDFKRAVVAARVGEERAVNGFADLEAYNDWLKEFDSKIAAFQAALGQERPTVK